jgi:hypothetical protein
MMRPFPTSRAGTLPISRHLLVMPDDTSQPLLAAIDGAKDLVLDVDGQGHRKDHRRRHDH